MNHIINFRGTNGSGKTTLVRALMKQMNHEKDFTTSNGVFTHIYRTSNDEFVSIIGSYDNAVTGGVDRVRSVRDIIQGVAEVSPFAHVIMEGLILSGLQTLTKEVADASPNSMLHAIHLTTPLDVCIQQTLARRAAAGNMKPFDPQRSLVDKHHAVELSHKKLTLWGMDSLMMSQKEAYIAACGYLSLTPSFSDQFELSL